MSGPHLRHTLARKQERQQQQQPRRMLTRLLLTSETGATRSPSSLFLPSFCYFQCFIKRACIPNERSIPRLTLSPCNSEFRIFTFLTRSLSLSLFRILIKTPISKCIASSYFKHTSQMDYNKILYSEIIFKPSLDNNNTNNNHVTHNNHINNGSHTPKHQLCDPQLVKLNWLQSEKVGGGLINVGNTCFLNSVLQCLTYCPPLYNFLVKSNAGHSSSCKINQFCMLCEMERLVKRIKNSTGTSIKPVSIVQRLKYINKSFQFGRQEDAHEFLRYIIDHMWKACLSNLNINQEYCKTNNLDPRIKETTVINHIFGGYHRSQVLCLSCNSTSNTFDFFMDFILDIRNAKSLEDSLKKFTQSETLENENAYKCFTCRQKVSARKRFTVFKAPNVATFQFKRFDSDRIIGGKITKFISYPDELDLKPYMSDPNTAVDTQYQLSSVLVHVGHSTNSGHYFCFVRNSNNFWYRMDDSNVSLVTQSTVLQQQAYLLFYTRKSKLHHKYQVSGDAITTTNDNNNIKNLNNNTNGNHNNSIQIASNNHHPNNNLNQNNHTNNHNSNPSSIFQPLKTWSGFRSKLDEESNKKKLSERDLFNEELDRGRVKKVKSRPQVEPFTMLNPFQQYNNRRFHDKHRSRK